VIRWTAESIESRLVHVCCSVCCSDQMNRWIDWVMFVACVLQCVLLRSDEPLSRLSHVCCMWVAVCVAGIRWTAELIESCLLHVWCSVCCCDQMNRWVDWVTFGACVLQCVLQRSDELLCWLSHVDMSAVSRNESLCIVLVCFIWICTKCDSCKSWKKKSKLLHQL